MNILLWFLERKHVGLPGNHFGSDAGFGSRLTIVRQSSIEHGSRQGHNAPEPTCTGQSRSPEEPCYSKHGTGQATIPASLWDAECKRDR